MDDHTDVVGFVKDGLVARGVDLTGPCGAFEITRRVAWILRGEGAGLLAKPSGNNCRGFAVDIVCFPDGSHFDILVNSETDNTPAWNVVKQPGSTARLRVDPARWVAPTNPDPDAAAPPATQTPIDVVSADTAERWLWRAEELIGALEETAAVVRALESRLEALQREGLRIRL